MYYIIYPILYLLSLLPFFLLYRLSDFFYFLAYYVVGYRKKVVLANLEIAFPQKTVAEREKIARQFYRNLIDTFIETIKLLSISDEAFWKRNSFDFSSIQDLLDKGKSIQLHSGHQMNWEYGHWCVAMKGNVPWLGVYMRINNKALDRLFYNLRNKGNTILVAAQEFRTRAHESFKSQFMLGLLADQNPGVPSKAFWLNFFDRPAPFVTGPDKGARKNHTAVVFVNLVKGKRGYYRFEPTIITEDAAAMAEGELTLQYRDFLEAAIRKDPANYLWSHRRWKWPYKKEYRERWIDTSEPV